MIIGEQTSRDRTDIEYLTNRALVLQVKNRHLTETLTAIQSSSAWTVARRLSNLRKLLAPDGSRRQRGGQLIVRGLRLWWREGLVAVARRGYHKIQRKFRCFAPSKNDTKRVGIAEYPRFVDMPLSDSFRVAFVGLGASCEAQSMRYRARNVLEAMNLLGIQGMFVTLEEVPAQMPNVLAHDLIVLVRMSLNSVTRMVIDSARQVGKPVVFDIDDYLFDPWVMPYVEAFRVQQQSNALRILGDYGECLQECDYFTGSTSYLAERAAALGKTSFVIPNGLNATQIRLSEYARGRHAADPRDGTIRIGYFSGTRTHQTDFRIIYPTLMALLRERRDTRLVIVGALDLDEFPGLMLYDDQIDILPFRNWKELPETTATIDINLIPLELTPFNEGKSNLKYFEAGLMKVPSLASPTRIHCDSIVHGHNGLLAETAQEWSDGLNKLIGNVQLRKQMGQNAFEHVLRSYAPLATATQAHEVYQQILKIHRAKRAA